MKRAAALIVLALFVIPIAYSAVKLTVNGVQYNYPQSGDIDWGDQATQWASAVSNGTLQKTGGTFTLTQEAGFGALYGIKSKYYKSLATNVASSGVLRLGYGETLAWRNSGNTADLPLYVSGSLLMFGSDTLATAAQTVELTNKTIDGLKNVITNISPGAVANLTDLNIDANAGIQWSKINKTGSSIADLTTRSAGDLTSGTVDNARLSSDVVLKDAAQTLTMKTISGSTNTISDIQPGSFSAGAISNNDISGTAAIAWTKIDKTGSNITDIATRSHTDLTDIGTTSHANLDIHIGSSAAHGVLSTIVGSTETQVLTNKDIDGGTASNTSRITIPKNTKANLDLLTRKQGTIVYATDESKAYIDNGSALAEVGSGSGSGGSIENVITNPTAETSGKVASDTWTCTNATVSISTGNASSPTHNFVITATSAGGYCEASFTTLAGRVNHDSYFYYKTTASDVVLGVYLGANLQNSTTLPSHSGMLSSEINGHGTFTTDGTATAGTIRVTMPTDTTIVYVDDVYAGLNQNIGSVAQGKATTVSYSGGTPSSSDAWVTSVTDNGTGDFTLNHASYGETLKCDCTPVQSSAAISCTLISSSTTTQRFKVVDASGSAVDENAVIVCAPTSSQTAVRVGTENKFSSITWRNVSGCNFGSISGVLSGGTCGEGTVVPAGSSVSSEDNLQMTVNGLLPGHIYKVSGLGTFLASTGTDTTRCQFAITDGTTIKGNSDSYAYYPYVGDNGANAPVGYYTYDSYQSSKTFQIIANRSVGSGSSTCLCNADNANRECGISIEEVYPTVSQPVIVNSVTTSYAGQKKIESATITPVDGSTCSLSQSGDWISSTTPVATGKCTVNFKSGYFQVAPRCWLVNEGSSSPTYLMGAGHGGTTTSSVSIWVGYSNTTLVLGAYQTSLFCVEN